MKVNKQDIYAIPVILAGTVIFVVSIMIWFALLTGFQLSIGWHSPLLPIIALSLFVNAGTYIIGRVSEILSGEGRDNARSI
jgi:hypothetical protein